MPSRARLSLLAMALPCVLAASACDDNTPDAPGGGGNQPDAPVGGGGNQPDAPAGGGGGGGLTCTTATLFGGDPDWDDPAQRPTDGVTTLTGDPPLGFRNIVFLNGQMITPVGEEIWRASLTDKVLHKLAGSEPLGQALKTGACSGARFSNIFGIAAAPDGSLFVSDQTANAILKITDPLGANCTVSHYAGTPTDLDSVSPDDPPNVGNTDNVPGAMAKFGLPERPTVDANGNVYVWDNGNDSIRKIANDADHTTTTVLKPVGGALITMTTLGNNLYVYGLDDDSDVFVQVVDLTNGNHHDLFTRGRSDIFDSAGGASTLGGIVTDGKDLIVFYNGRLFRITTAGVIDKNALAGVDNPGLDYTNAPAGYDPKGSHPANSVLFPGLGSTGTAGAEGWLAIDANKDLFVTFKVNGEYVVEQVACQ